jgi:hypothetical protein
MSENHAPGTREFANERKYKHAKEESLWTRRDWSFAKRVQGEVQHNDGYFAAIQTVGIEGLERNLLLAEIQIHVGDTSDRCEEFRRRFPVGAWVGIVTTTEVELKAQLESRESSGGSGGPTE